MHPHIPSYQTTHPPKRKKGTISTTTTHNPPSSNKNKGKPSTRMRPSAQPPTANTPALLLPILSGTLNCLLVVLAASTPSSAIPLATPASHVPIDSSSLSGASTSLIDLPPSPPFPFPAAVSSPKITSTERNPVLEKDYQEAQWISSGQQPPLNAKGYERKAAQKPGMIAVYVVCGVFVLVLTAAVAKALMYRSRHGGYWW